MLLLTSFLTIYVHFSHTPAGVITTSFTLSYLLSNPLQPHPIVCTSLQIITNVVLDWAQQFLLPCSSTQLCILYTRDQVR